MRLQHGIKEPSNTHDVNLLAVRSYSDAGPHLTPCPLFGVLGESGLLWAPYSKSSSIWSSTDEPGDKPWLPIYYEEESSRDRTPEKCRILSESSAESWSGDDD